jgi:hypothetical protein
MYNITSTPEKLCACALTDNENPRLAAGKLSTQHEVSLLSDIIHKSQSQPLC